ncbi:hypothetical protein NGRA_1371 [Nosema granulosis]|uniref:Uncharacterized protein n=1 Tax=Nosema granulosis TaxID=83296 RepID=A0A9P6KZ84_9MICR|nr:hypothetical protein NGRA_1371 [Nosema granulosis]
MNDKHYKCTSYYIRMNHPVTCDEEFSCIVTLNPADNSIHVFGRKRTECRDFEDINIALKYHMESENEEYEIKGTFLNSPYNIEYKHKYIQENIHSLVYYITERVSNTFPRCISSEMSKDILRSRLGPTLAATPCKTICLDMVEVCKSWLENRKLSSLGDNRIGIYARKETEPKYAPSCVNKMDSNRVESYNGKIELFSFQVEASIMAPENYVKKNIYHPCFLQTCLEYKDYYIRVLREKLNEGVWCVKKIEDIKNSLRYKWQHDSMLINKVDLFTTECPVEVLDYRIPHNKVVNGRRVPIVGGEYLEEKNQYNSNKEFDLSNLYDWPGLKNCVVLVSKSKNGKSKCQVFPCSYENSYYENIEIDNKKYGALRYTFNEKIDEKYRAVESIDRKYFIKEENSINQTTNTTKNTNLKSFKNENIFERKNSIKQSTSTTKTTDLKSFKHENDDFWERFDREMNKMGDIIDKGVNDIVSSPHDNINEKIQKINSELAGINKRINGPIRNNNLIISEKTKEVNVDNSNKKTCPEKCLEKKTTVSNNVTSLEKTNSLQSTKVHENRLETSVRLPSTTHRATTESTTTKPTTESTTTKPTTESTTTKPTTESTKTNEKNIICVEKASENILSENRTTESNTKDFINNQNSSKAEASFTSLPVLKENTTKTFENVTSEKKANINFLGIPPKDDCLDPEDLAYISQGNINFGKSVIGGNSFMDLDNLQYDEYLKYNDSVAYNDNTCFLGRTPCLDNNVTSQTNASSVGLQHCTGIVVLLVMVVFFLKRCMLR